MSLPDPDGVDASAEAKKNTDATLFTGTKGSNAHFNG